MQNHLESDLYQAAYLIARGIALNELQPIGSRIIFSFNRFLRVDFQGSRVTSDGGLLLVRELDERLGLCALIAEQITDDRRGKNTQLPLADLLRQSIYSRLAAKVIVRSGFR